MSFADRWVDETCAGVRRKWCSYKYSEGFEDRSNHKLVNCRETLKY